ncbi:MAG: SpaA isopeptide-forming pilin-related protein [Clostridia bacterium]|nr:SpaA isopeptide-forming pilin-related protein [Clostridia bacterium]
MKKKILKFALFSILLLSSFAICQKVNAEVYTGEAIWPSESISNIYIKKIRPDGYIKYQQARFLRRSEDNKFVYCLQPYVDIDNNLPYYNVARSDYATVLGLTEEQWDRISLLAYYGYTYDQNGYDHSAHKWYAITQVLIWQTTNPESQIGFTATLNGTINSNLFANEIAEIENLVANHYKRPSFDINDLVLPLGQNVVLTDTNNVLSNYKISSTENVSAVINGNQLTLTATGIGDAKVNLVKNAKKYEIAPIVYYSNHSQNVFRVGHYDPIPAIVNLTVVGGQVEINKLDSATKNNIPQGDGLLSNAVYGIYTTTNVKIGELITDSNGYAISDYLPSLGEFILKEITPSKGYELDSNTYRFNVDKDNLLASIDVYEKVIDNNITIFKVYASDKTGILTPEANVTFDIYLKTTNELYRSITTDSSGYANILLPYGTWIFKQKNSTPNYEKVEEFEIIVDENSNENIYKLISNAEITARLKVVKVDKETGEIINRSGIKFKIKNISSNEYICQKITYPTAQTLCEFETDSNGILITPYPLTSGKYQLEEVDQVLDGYLWNSESLEFEIGENSELITDEDYGVLFETKFENRAVKGAIEIYKYGEELIFNNFLLRVAPSLSNEYFYYEIPLSGVEYSLFDLDYNFITKVETDSNGYAKIENLKLGKYILKETATVGNHVIDLEEYEVELNYKDQYTPIIIKSFDFKNELAKATLEFTKLDFSTSEPIPNTKIEIYMLNDDEDILMGSYITDKDGKVVIDDLPSGYKYYILETDPSEGYILNTEKMYFEIIEDGSVIKSTMTNEKIKSILKIHKTDEMENPLQGVVIGIYDLNGELLFELTTDSSGLIEVELDYGNYYYQEISTLESYVLNDEKVFFDVVNNGEIIESILINKVIEIEVPNTNKDYNYIYIAIGSLMLIGIGMIIYGKKGKK